MINLNYFDLHCDTSYECYTKNQKFYVNELSVSGEQGEIFDNWTQTFAVWIKDNAENPFLLYKNILSDFKSKLENKPQNLKPILSVEGGAVIEEDFDRIYILKDDGIRFLTLTWNGENGIAGGVDSDKGLTDFGKEAINKMNRLKIGCDLSHINEKSFSGAIEYAEFPLATHSNSKKICNHKRNLTDEQIKLICEKGGIIGICFYPQFLGGDVFEKLYENIFHIADMGLENHIAIGSDFDGAEMDKRLNKIEKIADLYAFLKKKGLNNTLLDKILYENANNYIAKLE